MVRYSLEYPLMSTHDICFYGEISKIIPKLSPNTLFICSTVSPTLLFMSFTTFQAQVITYQLIGDDTMPTYFDFDSSTGVITVRQSLLQENRDFYVGRLVAYDAGSPPRSATATAIINISRNLNQPIFSPQFYNETILETASTNTVILRVTATDADRIVSVTWTRSCENVSYAICKQQRCRSDSRSLISTFVVRCFDSMICILAVSKVSRF